MTGLTAVLAGATGLVGGECLRQLLASNAELARRLDELEKKYDAQFKIVFDAIRQLMAPPPGPPKPRIGFHADPQES